MFHDPTLSAKREISMSNRLNIDGVIMQVGWGPLVVWLCLKVLARMFHVTMVLLETLATSEMTLSPVDMAESPVSTPTAGALQKHFSALPRRGSANAAQGVFSTAFSFPPSVILALHALLHRPHLATVAVLVVVLIYQQCSSQNYFSLATA